MNGSQQITILPERDIKYVFGPAVVLCAHCVMYLCMLRVFSSFFESRYYCDTQQQKFCMVAEVVYLVASISS